MGFRKFLSTWLNDEDTDAPPRSKSQLGFRLSRSAPPTLQRRKSQTTPVSGHPSPAPNVDEGKPAKLSSYAIDPTAAYENKLNWKSTLYASAGLAVDVLKESSDAFTPLKSVAGGLSAILKHYDV